jgi:hypothetical protein
MNAKKPRSMRKPEISAAANIPYDDFTGIFLQHNKYKDRHAVYKF